MEPCQFCGQQAAVDGAGFCTNCRNYRGVPAGQPTYPTSGPAYGGGQVSAPPYGQPSAPPYPQQPPVTGIPYSAPPGYNTAPYSAPPAYQAPAPPPKRSGYVVPIIALCSVVALLVIGIVVVVVVKNHDKGGGGGGNTGLTASGLDKCLVGSWKVTSYETTISFDQVGDVDFTGDDIRETLTIDENGIAEDNYGSESEPTVLSGSSVDHDYTINVYGTVKYTIKSANGVLSFSDATADGELELFIDGDSAGTIALNISSDPTPYTCTSSTLTQQTTDFSAVATRS